MIKETTIPEGEASSRRDQGKASQRNRKSLSRCDQAPARILGKNSRKSGDGHGEVPMRGRHYEPDAAATRDGSVLAQLGGVRHRDWCRGPLLAQESARSAQQVACAADESLDEAADNEASHRKGQGQVRVQRQEQGGMCTPREEQEEQGAEPERGGRLAEAKEQR